MHFIPEYLASHGNERVRAFFICSICCLERLHLVLQCSLLFAMCPKRVYEWELRGNLGRDAPRAMPILVGLAVIRHGICNVHITFAELYIMLNFNVDITNKMIV